MDTTLQSTLDNLTFDQARQNLTAAGYPPLTETAIRAGSTSAPQTTPSIDASNIGSPQAQPMDTTAFDQAQTSGEIEDQIRAASAFFATNQQIQDTENILTMLGEDVIDTQLALGDIPAEQAKLERKVGLGDLRTQQRDVFAQAQKLQASLAKGLADEEGRVVPMEVITGRQAQMRKQAAAELSGLAAISSALEGQIATAQEYVNQQVNIKYSALEGQLNALNTALDLNKDRMTRQEARLAEKRQTEISLMMNRLENQQALDRSYMQFAVNAVGDGRISAATGQQIMQGISVGDYSKLALIPTPVSQSGFFAEAMKLAESQTQEVDKALGIQKMIEELKNHTALGAATGPLGSRVPSWKTLTGETTEFAAIHEQLVNSLTLENLDLMSGVLSETDIKILSGAATRLRRDMSKEAYVRELNNLNSVFQRTINKFGTTSEQEQFFFGLGQDDIDEINQYYSSTSSTQSTFSAADYY